MEEDQSLFLNFKVPNGTKQPLWKYFLINHKEKQIMGSAYEFKDIERLHHVLGTNPIHYILKYNGTDRIEVFIEGKFEFDELFQLIYLKQFNVKETDKQLHFLNDLILSYRQKKGFE